MSRSQLVAYVIVALVWMAPFTAAGRHSVLLLVVAAVVLALLLAAFSFTSLLKENPKLTLLAILLAVCGLAAGRSSALDEASRSATSVAPRGLSADDRAALRPVVDAGVAQPPPVPTTPPQAPPLTREQINRIAEIEGRRFAVNRFTQRQIENGSPMRAVALGEEAREISIRMESGQCTLALLRSVFGPSIASYRRVGFRRIFCSGFFNNAALDL